LLAVFNVVTALDGFNLPTSAAEVRTLRDAVYLADLTPGRDVINLPHGTIDLTQVSSPYTPHGLRGDLDVLDRVDIYGQGDTVIDAHGLFRAFQITGNYDVTFHDLTIQNGNAGADPEGLWVMPSAGGAVAVGGTARVTFENVQFVNNTATG